MTCWRRLRDWNEAGVWQKLHERLLAELHEADRIDWDRALIDTASCGLAAVADGPPPARSTAARKGASTRSSPMRAGIPLVAETTAANVPRRQSMIPLVDAIPTGCAAGRAAPDAGRAALWRSGYDSDRIAGFAPARHPSRRSRGGGRRNGEAGWGNIDGT